MVQMWNKNIDTAWTIHGKNQILKWVFKVKTVDPRLESARDRVEKLDRVGGSTVLLYIV